MIEAALIVAAYFAGSLPFGYWLVRVFRGADIRTLGSKNTGMTNVWRNFGWRFGVATLLLDVVKGALPALAALHWSGSLTASIAGIAAMLGHGYPVLLGFGGGKGVATSAGVVLAVTPLHGIALVLVFAIVLWLFRYVSLASMVAAVLYPLTCLATGEPWPVIVFGAIAALGIVARHRANIGRLRAGTESQTRSFGRGAPGRGAT